LLGYFSSNQAIGWIANFDLLWHSILSFAHGCPLSLNPAQLAAFMKIPEKDRYIMVDNLSFENDRERPSLRLLNDR
jgi:hypothetical protein